MYFMRIKGGNIDNMKAITVIQPWASLLAEGAKLYETRSWKTNYRGEILIHAGKKDPLFGIVAMGDEAWIDACIALGIYGTVNRFEYLPTGAIIGKARLVNCIEITPGFSERMRRDFPTEYSFGERKGYCKSRKRGGTYGRNQRTDKRHHFIGEYFPDRACKADGMHTAEHKR